MTPEQIHEMFQRIRSEQEAKGKLEDCVKKMSPELRRFLIKEMPYLRKRARLKAIRGARRDGSVTLKGDCDL